MEGTYKNWAKFCDLFLYCCNWPMSYISLELHIQISTFLGGKGGGEADILWWNILLTIWAPLLFILLKKNFKFSLRDHFYVWFCICSSSMCDFLFVWSGYRKQTFFFLLKWRFAFIFIFLFGIPRNNLISC